MLLPALATLALLVQGPSVTIEGPAAVAVGGRARLVATASDGGTLSWSVEPVPGTPGRRAPLHPSVSLLPGANGETTLVGLAPSAPGGVVVVATRVQGGVATQARHVVTVATGDLTAYRPRHGAGTFPFARTAVPDAVEEDPELGPGIRVNGPGDADPAGEDDLIEVVLSSPVAGLAVVVEGSGVVLALSIPSLSVWRTATRDPGTEVPFTGNRTVAIPLPRTLWVEWTGAHGTAELALVPAGTSGALDRLRFHSFRSIVLALGGEDQVPMLPPDPNHGTFRIGKELYELGFDAYLWDEDAVSADGSGAVYDATVDAIQHRGVEEVVPFGYSHGGGSTYDLLELLDANKGGIGAFTVPFSSYVDSVDNGSDTATGMELRLPIATGFHANHYQHGQFIPDFFLDGGPVPGSHPPPDGLDVETTVWGATATHFEVDDFDEVIDYVRENLVTRATR